MCVWVLCVIADYGSLLFLLVYRFLLLVRYVLYCTYGRYVLRSILTYFVFITVCPTVLSVLILLCCSTIYY